MNYTTYWSILDSPSHTIKSNSIYVIIVIIFGLLWVLTKKFKKDKGEGDRLILLWGTGTFAVLGLTGYIVTTFVYKDHSDTETLKRLNAPIALKVEGIVSNFQRTYRNTRGGSETIESFTVDSVQFAYGDALLGRFGSFSQTNNNVIYNGQPVRITYCESSPYGDNFNSILKLEIGKEMTFTETEILEQLDLAFNGTPGKYYPSGRPGDIKYNFFPDLENGYCEVASSRIHLYADATKWAIVFETGGYETRAHDAEIMLNYVGNCIDYPIDEYSEQRYVTNSSRIIIIDQEEFERIKNTDGVGMETFELIGQNIKDIKIRNTVISFENDYKKYEQLGIKHRDHNNPKKLIDFGSLVRYLNETNTGLTSATEIDIKKHIPSDLPKLMTINRFHFVSIHDKSNPPSMQETYKLIAKVLVTRDTAFWKPALKANNHWANWESGKL